MSSSNYLIAEGDLHQILSYLNSSRSIIYRCLSEPLDILSTAMVASGLRNEDQAPLDLSGAPPVQIAAGKPEAYLRQCKKTIKKSEKKAANKLKLKQIYSNSMDTL